MQHLIIDCDPGVDDALALMMAFASDQVVVDRITTVDGNVPLDQVARNAATVLELCGRTDVPLHRGADHPLEREPMPASRAHGGDGLGDSGYAAREPWADARGAVDALLEESRSTPGGITILALGPLTNLARAVRQDPTFPQRVRRLVIMGGAEFTGNVTPSAEFNILHDPEAAEVVFGAGFPPIEMIGLDATRQVFMSPGIRELVRQLGGTTGRFIHDVTEKYVDHYWRKYREVGAELCDPLAFAHLVDPDLIDLVPARVEIATSGVCDGRTVVWRTSRYRDQEPNALVATSVDARRFFDALLGSLFPEHTADIARVLDRELSPGGTR
ncbi:nucleoside hydrolase [Brachybacterium subflavum]|uniref:nucleoside hydrolase n=1 Tax=Brachybacterium subflavum TaxID=2585206 RepID=UPI0018797362|nr:nucleoside hydrolase [Brachybacterium subflavum]